MRWPGLTRTPLAIAGDGEGVGKMLPGKGEGVGQMLTDKTGGGPGE